MIRKLTREEIIDTYNQHLVTDFPEDEVKPLAIILDFYDHHRYECYGLFQEDKMLAYAYFADFKAENIDAYLLDYYAVVKTARNQGIGSQLLNELLPTLEKHRCILIEIESLNTARNQEEATLRKRRRDFYLRNQVQLSQVMAQAFDVEYQIMYYAKEVLEDAFIHQQVQLVYQELFASFTPRPFEVYPL